jgi:hypothetical protein
MIMGALLAVFALLDFPFILGGHLYDVGGSPRGEPRGDDEAGGIGMASLIAVLIVTLVAVGLLVWLSPSSAGRKLKALAPMALPVAVAAPLILWAATSGGDEKSLIVERATGLSGAPELIISLGDQGLNTLETTNGKRAVRVQCLGREGHVVLDAKLRWPFIISERGYDSPHVHQSASAEQVRRADRCRLRGTRSRLEADVEGALTR